MIPLVLLPINIIASVLGFLVSSAVNLVSGIIGLSLIVAVVVVVAWWLNTM